MENKLSKEELEQRMREKIRQIPTPQLSEKQKQMMHDQNRDQDRSNIEHTMHMMKERQQEASTCGDTKKQFVAMFVERDQSDQFHVRQRLDDLNQQFVRIQKTIPEEDWCLLEPMIDYDGSIIMQGDNAQQELHKFFRDEFQIQPKYITKLIELIKIRQEIKRLEKI